ncbi:hypothetical protein GCM10017044_20420 [Kordiimonas sediminis]|uniref:Chain length determinant protein tyrosine kinase EpsG n=1 Tax=Kordiimonas sediminis TaxID=1735581 RepID=A0A919AT06_9PROT|nr:polysaccharide biosynthesis tyrosine autokinase [Kordiimonas sediminis]GHF25526.1 hypothetical protein GCM10017044_20420 [Kordiimonas sediminis]
MKSTTKTPKKPLAADQKIGEILLKAGKIKATDVDNIIDYQQINNLTFGQAAIEMGLLDSEDIDSAIARQFDYAIIEKKSNSSYSEELCVALQPQGVQAESFRALRSQLMLNSLEKGRRALTIVAPTTECGCTYIAANLALSLAQLNLKTCLIDANLRTPRIANMFGISPQHSGLSGILRGTKDYDDVIIRDVFPNLALLVAGNTPPNPQELLAKNELIWTLSHLLREFDVVLFDTPPMNRFADARTVSARVGSAVLVVRQHHTLASDTETAVSELTQSGSEVVGSVLNKF